MNRQPILPTSNGYCACTPCSLIYPGAACGFVVITQRVSIEQLAKADREWREQRCADERRQEDCYTQYEHVRTEGNVGKSEVGCYALLTRWL
jgi:hypothetical protein